MEANKKVKTLFLDRDGVINSTADGFVNQLQDFIFIEGVVDALRQLSNHFQRIFVVTNQAGVGYGYMKKETLEGIHDHMIREVTNRGGRIDKVYYCPDRVSQGAKCRKPNTGMALQAKRDFPEINFEDAWMVGDMDTDIEFGNRLNMKTVKIANEHIAEAMQASVKADYYFSNLSEFANFYLESKSK